MVQVSVWEYAQQELLLLKRERLNRFQKRQWKKGRKKVPQNTSFKNVFAVIILKKTLYYFPVARMAKAFGCALNAYPL
jgi:hypothetical protein